MYNDKNVPNMKFVRGEYYYHAKEISVKDDKIEVKIWLIFKSKRFYHLCLLQILGFGNNGNES